MSRRSVAIAALPLLLAGCLSYDQNAAEAVTALQRGDAAAALKWTEDLANDGTSERLAVVEAGRIGMLSGSNTLAEVCFRKAIDSAIDHSEKDPVIKLGDVAGTAMAATLFDDWSMEYYLSPYEINLALEYGILAQLMNGKREDALVDARLSCYIQDKLASEYGADLQRQVDSAEEKNRGEVNRIVDEQSNALNEMIANTRNSWENPVLWWLTGLLLEADGDNEAAGQSYRRAGTTGAGNPFFEADMRRADTGERTPAPNRAKLAVIFEDGLVPRRAALKIPLKIYALMSIDIPTYLKVGAYVPRSISIAGASGMKSAAMGLNVRALAAKGLSEKMAGIVTRNVTRAAVNVGIEAVGRSSNNKNVKLAAGIVNLILVASRKADTRSWVTLPDAQYVWCDEQMEAGDYQLAVDVGGVTSVVPISLAAGETKLLWLADYGSGLKARCATISNK